MQGKRVLVADDNRFIRTLVKAALTTVGYEVEEAVDGQDAHRRIVADPPDIVLLDLVMPEMSGFDVLERFTAEGVPLPCPVMMLTTAARPSDISRAKELGASGYLVKPFDKDDLRQKVAALLAE